MAVKRTLIALVLAVAVCGAVPACSRDAESPEPAPAEADASASQEPTGEWAQTLPTAPGYTWGAARYPGGGTIPVQLAVSGPWTLTVGADWPVYTTEVVDPADVPGLDQFENLDYVEKTVDGATEYYYPRQVTNEWMLQLGKVSVTNGQATAEPYAAPLKLWPVDFEVGDTFVLSEGGSFGVNATVLGHSAVTVPAGTIDDAYLVRFDYAALAEGAISGTQYYILSPEVGVVAFFGVATGDEATGFTALDSAQILVTMPEKQ